MAHHHLRLKLSYGIQRDADDNHDRRSAQGNIDLCDRAEDDRQDCHDAEEQTAHQGDFIEYLGDEVRGGLARTDTGDTTVILAISIGLDGIAT